ncbi:MULTISPECIES: cAMP-activated global transcriptional regulator CRP [Cycloclasticus]|jgi:CRP/FNR family cyclic AMP-dependent transcriptional regulator|nr:MULTISPECIES: cAMP-activated global transcriptional regulator CRP [Cycloclasticus]AFT68030.1 Cyclic AMP receptor-like protein [Cycloclasticus sp. P1]MBV1899504.1 cAMP-activated global transcriptional regulator CRP [Cycloclasticus sp.]MDF1830066.1 cAMP-activated global transcriptional regulator CRP [Cycloclasticus pugetii]PHR50792.1 MAG: cAMP-activated global transcriptional regulator CRP [Cycloclasticus sp.]
MSTKKNLLNFSGMSDETFARFIRFCHRHEYPNKTDIIQPGDEINTLYYFIEGSAYVCIDEVDGHEFILANLSRGDFLGEASFFEPTLTRDKQNVYVQTSSSCQLAGISYNRLNSLLKNELQADSKEIITVLGRQLAKRLLQTSRKAGRLAFLDVSGRVARTLIDLTEAPEAMTHPDGMQIKITRQDLGRMVGCSREMAGRVLKTMGEDGLIEVSGKTILVKKAR